MSQFIPELHRPDSLDPLAPDLHTEFPHGDVQARLDGIMSELPAHDFEKLRFVLAEIMRWVCFTKLNDTAAEARIGRRFLALTWATNPALIQGEPSLTKLAKRLGLSKSELSSHAADASRKFQVENRFRSHSRHCVKGSP